MRTATRATIVGASRFGVWGRIKAVPRRPRPSAFSHDMTPRLVRRCPWGCSFWDCGREAGHAGPCFPMDKEGLTC